MNQQQQNESHMEDKKKVRDIILVSLPVVGMFYAGFRMLFKISKHFGSRRSFYGLRFWKSWFSCAFIMLASMLATSPIIICLYSITKLENVTLTAVFTILFFEAWGFADYFLTDFVIKVTKPVNGSKNKSVVASLSDNADSNF